MTKLLITGHSVGNDLDLCQSCGFDCEWLFRYPATLLWADKILLTKSTWRFITDREEPRNTPFEKSTKVVFELLYDAGLIEVFDPTTIIDNNTRNSIISTVENDVKKMKERLPEIVRPGDADKVPGEFHINDDHYCSPFMYSVYASLLLAKFMDAQCLFNKRVLNYCNIRFGMAARSLTQETEQIESFQTVLSSLFPNEPLLPEYTIYSERKDGVEICNNCKNENKCSDSYLLTTEKQTLKLLDSREKEEIHASRELIKRILKEKSNTDATAEDIKNQFFRECQKLSKRNKKTFRNIKHWCSLSMMLSIPMTIFGIASPNTTMLAAGATTLTLSNAIRSLVDSLQEKYRWTAMINRSTDNDKAFYIKPK